VCDLETSRMGAPYIYDISHLRVKSGSLNLLEPSGPVQACNGIVLPLPLHVSATVGPLVGKKIIKRG